MSLEEEEEGRKEERIGLKKSERERVGKRKDGMKRAREKLK